MRYLLTASIVALSTVGIGHPGAQDPRGLPVFRSAVDRVTVATTVRDRSGRPVTTLTRDDFQLFDAGQPRAIADFRSETTTLSLALLVDFSGSMGLADRRAAAREAAGQLLSWIRPDDSVGLFVFDRTLREIAPFGSTGAQIVAGLDALRPFGMTSLFDAIAETGRVVAAENGTHRAVIALTDGDDNASRLTAMRVSAIASGVDVPVYLLVLAPPGDRAGRSPDETGLDAASQGRLADLARWTGGQSFIASSPARSSTAVRQIVTELRHQYVIAFEPNPRPGWHAIDIRTRQKDLVVRARSGYVVDGPEGDQGGGTSCGNRSSD